MKLVKKMEKTSYYDGYDNGYEDAKEFYIDEDNQKYRIRIPACFLDFTTKCNKHSGATKDAGGNRAGLSPAD